ncbi:probable E3 ubiquitin-protein ligase HERC4 [Amia ocellicauda]|uniref:probable E3 ubiquitin-protein ligase HERC4 n=1 Tax=Amia ocellicauda TaxID=2972642 RepID=UPI003464797F
MYCWGEATWEEFAFLFKENDKNGKDKYKNPFFTRKLIVGISYTSGGTAAFLEANGTATIWIKEENGHSPNGGTHYICRLRKGETINSLCTGKHSALLVSSKGNLYEWKFTCSSIPPKIQLIYSDANLIQIACGNHHSLALTKEGCVFEWNTRAITRCSGLSGIPVSQVAAGGNHSFVLSHSGAVFGWGCNRAGQLGLGDTQDRPLPQFVKCLQLKKTVFISCGEEHTVVLTKDGLVYTFGSGRSGQLGHNSDRNELRPRLVAELWGVKVTQIACGSYHTLAFVSSSGKVYSFGRAQQGIKRNNNYKIPLQVKLPSEKSVSLSTDRICAGGKQSFVLCSEKKDSEPLQNTPMKPGRRISRVDHSMVKKWIARSDAKSRRNSKVEIAAIFSAPSCVNASFLRKDGHFQTSGENSGLDFASIRETFEALAANDLILQIETTVEKTLLPSLSTVPVLAEAEALRVFLIVSELIGVLHSLQHSATELTVALAAAISSLQPSSLQLLESLWLVTPAEFFERAVVGFRDVCNHIVLKIDEDPIQNWKKLNNIFSVLQKLSNVNSRRENMIPRNTFYIKIMSNDLLKILKNPLMEYPCVFDTETKDEIFQKRCAISWWPYKGNVHNVQVKRDAILRDTLQVLRSKSAVEYKLPLQVSFENEPAIDQGGVKKEFFSVISRQLVEKGQTFFVVDDTSGLVWFKPENCSDMYHLVGILCGMALYNHCVADLHFPSVLFKKLLAMEPTLDDFLELHPTLGRTLQDVLDEEEDNIENLYLDFTVQVGVQQHELIANGRDIPVTKYNRQEYVDKYVDFFLNKSVKKQFEDFKRGFLFGCPCEMWTVFFPDELKTVLSGTEVFDWTVLEKTTKYGGYDSTDKTVRNFWSVFYGLEEEKKKHFLAFLTGSDRLSVGGLRTVRMTIWNNGYQNPDDYFPEVSTCVRALNLPDYSNISILRKQLLHVLTLHEGFGRN